MIRALQDQSNLHFCHNRFSILNQLKILMLIRIQLPSKLLQEVHSPQLKLQSQRSSARELDKLKLLVKSGTEIQITGARTSMECKVRTLRGCQ